MRIGPYNFRPGLVPTLVTGALLPLLIFLGFWQIDRAAEKQLHLDQYASQAHLPPQIWPQQAIENQGFHPVRVYGQYQAKQHYLLDNQVHQGVVGFHVFTPFAVNGGTMALLVNRGWVPQDPSRKTLPSIPTPTGTVELIGRFHPPPGIGIKMGSPTPTGNWPRIIPYVELSALKAQMAQQMTGPWAQPLYPKILKLDRTDPNGFVRTWQHFSFGPNRHYAYAVQWFGLAMALLLLYSIINLTRRSDNHYE